MSLTEDALAFCKALLDGRSNEHGQDLLACAHERSMILARFGASESMQAAGILSLACPILAKPQETLTTRFGAPLASMAHDSFLIELASAQSMTGPQAQAEQARKMLLAFSRDLRVVLILLTGRLQTLRHFALSKKSCPAAFARESLTLHASLANRLGLFDLKWEMEDLALRFAEPDAYKSIAALLEQKRSARESALNQIQSSIESELVNEGIQVEVFGRPKHIYSIWKKMNAKKLAFEQISDLQALRIIVTDVADCYRCLDWVHRRFEPVIEEFDDYIAKPKANGYQSLHTIVEDDSGRRMEIQIRSRDMHLAAETGSHAHWAYKETGSKNFTSPVQGYEAQIAALRELIDWQSQVPCEATSDRIYAFTPLAQLVDLPRGSTPIDFAYAVHTDLGHRCRGAKINGAMVSLNTPIQTGQRVEIIAIKDGGPSRDWLNSELGYLKSPRSIAKARAWLNAQAIESTRSKGRDIVEKTMAREGKSGMAVDALAQKLGFKNAQALYEAAGKEELLKTSLETAIRGDSTTKPPESLFKKHAPAKASTSGDVLVVGDGSLLTFIAPCCKPAPPDSISGYVTKGRGVAVHRKSCPRLADMVDKSPGRLIAVGWDGLAQAKYSFDIQLTAHDRQGLLRDLAEAMAKDKANVIATQSRSDAGLARMNFTLEISGTLGIEPLLDRLRLIPGILSAQRKTIS